jgi:hypothetical protein
MQKRGLVVHNSRLKPAPRGTASQTPRIHRFVEPWFRPTFFDLVKRHVAEFRAQNGAAP